MGLAALMIGIGLLVTGQAGGSENPATLVARLGSARYVERQAASEALEKLGREALPALRDARNHEDPEVRQRVRNLLSRIASDRMVQATMLRLDFVNRPLPEVVAELSSRAGMPLQLMPEDPGAWRGRQVTLQADVPVPFWVALDRLSEAGQVRLMPVGMGGVGGGSLVLTTGPSGTSGPTSDRGPFRTVVTRIHREQARTFGPGPGAAFEPAVILGPNGRPIPNAPRVGGGGVAAEGRLTELFAVDLQITVEPRMSLSQTGAPRLTAAVDDLGQSMLPTPEGAPGGMARAVSFGGATSMGGVVVSIPLKFPGRAGRLLKELAGTIPVLLTARKEEPLVIALDGAVGRTFESEDASITIHALEPLPNNQPGTQIELTVAPRAAAEPPSADGLVGGGAPMWLARQPGMGAQGPIEILDAQGRAYRQWFPRSSQVSPEEVRMTLSLMAAEGLGPPSQLRYYGMTRAQAEVDFHFKDLPLFEEEPDRP
jgi:hypothetical protein